MKKSMLFVLAVIIIMVAYSVTHLRNKPCGITSNGNITSNANISK